MLYGVVNSSRLCGGIHALSHACVALFIVITHSFRYHHDPTIALLINSLSNALGAYSPLSMRSFVLVIHSSPSHILHSHSLFTSICRSIHSSLPTHFHMPYKLTIYEYRS